MPVSAEKEKALALRMQELGVSENDLEESFVRSSGPGGQKVNKTSSCVHLLHLPTGLSVKCQRERSQTLNRHLARRLLLDKIERMQKGFIAEEQEKIEKLRRQKRKRSRRAKEKMLAAKHKRSETKGLREKVVAD
ncbi:MAG: peptide chain release factor-like protein [Smithellaceae bacterium]|jgi:protein subunit release factor B|nr:peptide chain release factor-like protein [Smithellaceae bacterium]HBJ73953.1 peptide chain release factor-like protein [Syntrophaceae bacterium]HCS77149.1 peptide chain release factor-like protein [Syntrophaceae bacterium]HCX02510.1 peptide chain release factor-like protein [Syntrophaceae bacterium]